MEGDGKGTICVTGGTGFLASWIIKRLLEDGYSVRTTIRSEPENKRDTSFLTNLPGASKNLKIFNADLANPNTFTTALFEGCTGVFHLAHPIDYEDKESEEVKTQRAINGTLAILKACINSKTVKRVVFTSSASTVVFNGKGLDLMDESSWSDVDLVRSLKVLGGSYFVSKTLTERAALEFGEEHGLSLVTVAPSYIAGPFLCPGLPLSVHILLAMIFGDKDLYDLITWTTLVHVDDVARAHIHLLEYPDAKGRYICSAEVLTIQELSEFLSAKFPEYQIPNAESLKEFKGFNYGVLSSKKLLDTGFKFKYGLNEMFSDAIQCCKEKGFL